MAPVASSSALSPLSPQNRTSSRSITPANPLDPSALLDSLDSNRSRVAANGGDGTTSQTLPPFDPIDFLNQHFVTEHSLSQQLPSLRDAVGSRMQVLNDRISDALQKQSDTADSTRRHVHEAQASVVELQRRILQVKDKASQSEKAVLEITADMKRLDCAKQHLQRTITTLKQLHMLVHAVEQLRLIVREKPFPDYKTASHLVDAITQLFQHFTAYTTKVQPMRILAAKVTEYQETLRVSLVSGFRMVAFGYRKAMRLEGRVMSEDEDDDDEEYSRNLPGRQCMSVVVMQGGILFIDSLGQNCRVRFIHDFCQDLLGEYLHEFTPPDRNAKPTQRVSSFKVAEQKIEPENAFAGLAHVEKRFTWFLNGPLQSINNKFPSVFPSKWNLQASLSSIFLQLTRDHILALLDGPHRDPDGNNATILLKALQTTTKFEKDVTAWLERECGAVFEMADSPNEGTSLKPLIGLASSSYESYMDPYIRLEEQSMDEQLAEAIEDRTVDTRGELPVFISSTNLFVYIKGSITRCTAMTKGNAFFLLYGAFKSSLKKYAQILDRKLPSPIPMQGPNVGGIVIAPFGGKHENTGANASYRIPPGEETTVCHVISTCEYCADTMEALEDLVRDTINDEFKARVDMISDQERFHDITAKSIRVLVSGLCNRMEGAMKNMSSMNWGACDAVGEESAYVLNIHEEVEPFVKAVRNLLPSSYFRSFCDKFASTFIATYFDNLIRLKRISEPGTQQLLLDLYNLKTLFLKLPVLEDLGRKVTSTGPSIAPAMYTKTMQKQFGRMETILKLVGTPLDLLIDNFKVQWPGGTSADFVIIMNLKGMKRPEQATMLEKFGYDPVAALKGATAGVTSTALVAERVQQLQDQGSTVVNKVNSDLNQMRQKVDDFRKSLR